MDGQLLIVGLVVAAAGAYLLRSAWKTWAGKKTGCGSGCGRCVPAAEPEKPGRIRLV
jgi:hypothetical protein